MPDSDCPVGSKSETKYETGGIQQALSAAPFSGEVQNLVQWFETLGPVERLGVLQTLAGKCTENELRFLKEVASHSQDEKFGVFDRLVRDSQLEHRSPLRLPNGATTGPATAPSAPHSPIRPYIGKQDHFSQAFLRPQTFNPWPLSQEIIRPKSATDWWSTPQPKPIGRPKDDKHHSDGESERGAPRRPMASAPSTPTPGHATTSVGSMMAKAQAAQAQAKSAGSPFLGSPGPQGPHAPHASHASASSSHGSHGSSGHGSHGSHGSHSAHGTPHSSGSGAPHRPVNYMDPALLADMGTWLRSLRLHKYTDNLGGMKWQEVIKLDDKQLEARGVNALGARRKMLKMFEEIRAAQEAGKL